MPLLILLEPNINLFLSKIAKYFAHETRLQWKNVVVVSLFQLFSKSIRSDYKTFPFFNVLSIGQSKRSKYFSLYLKNINDLFLKTMLKNTPPSTISTNLLYCLPPHEGARY